MPAAKTSGAVVLTLFVPQIENLPERMEICGQGLDERGRRYSNKGRVEVTRNLNSTSKTAVLNKIKSSEKISSVFRERTFRRTEFKLV